MAAEIARLSPQDAKPPSIVSWPRTSAKMAAFGPVLQQPFTSYLDFLRPDVLKALPLLRPWRSVDGDLARLFKDPRIRLAFSFQSKYLGMSPFNCPSLFTILSFIEYEYGVFHPQRRLWCGHAGDGAGGAAYGCRYPDQRAGRRNPVRGPEGETPYAPNQGIIPR